MPLRYITSRLKLAGVSEPLFTEDALEHIHSSLNELIRRINSLVRLTLLSAAKEKLKAIDSEFIFKAHNELEINV
ncbi:MAG: hypothetical protein KAX49_07655 [Halanaerobiales bacterium]|nr:hypothetical protein [Halanaerobiales bacterium]